MASTALPAACAEGEGVRCQHPGGPGALEPGLQFSSGEGWCHAHPQSPPLLKGRPSPESTGKARGGSVPTTTLLQDLTPGGRRVARPQGCRPRGISTPVRAATARGACQNQRVCLPLRGVCARSTGDTQWCWSLPVMPPGAARTDFHQEKNEGLLEDSECSLPPPT